MDDLISRKVLIDFLDETVPEEEMLVSQYNADWIYSFIESAPTVDAVEVVRCKDCKHYGGITFGRTCRRFSGMHTRIEMPEDGFCSYGERKENGDEAD